MKNLYTYNPHITSENRIGFDNFEKYVEGLPKDKRIVSVTKLNPDSFPDKKTVGYIFKYNSEGIENSFWLVLEPDSLEEELNGGDQLLENRLTVYAPVLEFDNDISIETVFVIEDLIEWHLEDWHFVYLYKVQDKDRRVLALESNHEEFASEYTLDDIKVCIKDILDNVPKIISKAKEIGLIP